MLKKFDHIRRGAEERHIPVIRPRSAEVLYGVVRAAAPRRILEIGTAVGYSGLVMLTAAPDAALVTVEIKPELHAEAAANFAAAGVSERVRQYLGDAGEILSFLSGEFDLVFLDGPKTKYPEYFYAIKPLLTPGGILVADNIGLGGRVSGAVETPRNKRTITEGVAKFLKIIDGDPAMKVDTLDIEDGMVICTKV